MREEEGVGHGAEGDVREVVEGGAEGVALAGDPPLGADLVVVVLGAGLGLGVNSIEIMNFGH